MYVPARHAVLVAALHQYPASQSIGKIVFWGQYFPVGQSKH